MRWWMTGLVALAASTAAQAATYQVVDRIPGPDGGWDYVRVDPSHNQLLAPRGSGVMAVDLASRKVTSGLAPGARQHIALPVNGGAEMLVTNGGTDTAVFADPRTGVATATVATGKGPDDAAFDPHSGLVLVIDHAGGDVTLVDPRSHQAVGRIAVGGALEAAAVDGAGRAFIDVEDRNEVVVLDVAGRKVIAHHALPGCDGPTGIAYDAADRLLVVACDGATALVRADTGQVVQTLPTGKGADGVVYDARRRLAFVPAGRDGTLAVIAIAGGKGRIVQTVTTQRGARTIALDERTGRLYLPAAQYAVTTGAGRPTAVPGSFEMLVVGPR